MGQKDDELDDDFEALLERQSNAGESAWKQADPEQEESRLQTERTPNADGVADSSANGQSSDETAEQEKLAQSVSAFGVASEIAELVSDEELALIKASQEPDAPSDPNTLAELLQAQHAEQLIETVKLVIVPIIPGNGTAEQPNPGWSVISLREKQNTAKDLGLEDELAETYRRDTYDANQLTLEQICETLDKTAVDIQRMIRKRSALKLVASQRIKAQTAEGKLTKAQRKQVETDMATVPGTYAEVQAKKVKRESRASGTGEPAKPKLLAKEKQMVDNFIINGFTPEEAGAKLKSKNLLTPEIAQYINTLDEAACAAIIEAAKKK